MATDRERIDRYIDEHFDEMVSTLQSLIQIPSYYMEPKEGMPYGEGAAKALHKALSICEEAGFETRNFDNYVGTATYGGEPELGIMFHVDVVPEGEDWSMPAFEGVVRDGRIYGRGANDDKGPGVASIFALRAIKDLGIPLKKGVRLIIGTAEEIGCVEVDYYLQHEAMPPKFFTPDSFFPVVNVEKGILRYSISADYAKEEHERAILEIHGSKAINTIPAEATAIVKGFSIEELSAAAEKEVPSIHFSFETLPNGIKVIAEGTAAHAAWPHNGNNSLTGLLKMLLSLPFDDCEGLRRLRTVSQMFPHGDYLGKEIGIATSDGKRSGDLTLSFTVLEYSVDSLSATIDIRLPIICRPDDVKAGLDEIMKAKDLKGETLLATNAHSVPEDDEFVQSLVQAYNECRDDVKGCIYCGGGTYAYHFEGAVAFGPKIEGRVDPHMHGADEFLELEILKDSAKIYARAILNNCG